MTSGTQIRAEQVEITGIPLMSIIMSAFGITRIEGAPDWVRSERYDIRAKAPMPSSRQEMLKMLQTLLAERFKLKAHRETRTIDVYGLVLANANNSLGTGMHPVNVDCETNTMTGLSGSLGRPVFDKTGLTGTFDIELNYIREMPPGPGFSERPAGPPAPEGVSLRDALKQQLGLDLRSERGPVEFFVIDSIERPASN